MLPLSFEVKNSFCIVSCYVFGLVAGALWSRKYERYLEVANWIVSSMHAIVTTGVGILIVKNTRHDLIYAKCALTGTTTFPEKRKRKL